LDYERAIRGWPVRVACLGDSITRGWPAVRPEETFPALVQEALRERGHRALVVNAGVAGERADQGLARLGPDVLAWRPAVATVMFGTNDCGHDDWGNTPAVTIEAYRATLMELVGRLRSAGVRPILMTPPPLGAKGVAETGVSLDVLLGDFVAATRELASAAGVPLVDLHADWSARAASRRIDPGVWTVDNCHPDAEGHGMIATALRPVVEAELAEWGVVLATEDLSRIGSAGVRQRRGQTSPRPFPSCRCSPENLSNKGMGHGV
jgi:acyl-CoA thioesterase-1